jgi:3-phytase
LQPNIEPGRLELSFLSHRLQANHLGSFFVEGVGETDGVHHVPVPIGRRYPLGLLVVQNGDGPEPPSTDPVNGFEFDGSRQLKYVDFAETLKALFPVKRH